MSVWTTDDGHRIEITISLADDTTQTSFTVTDVNGEQVGQYDTLEQLLRVIDVATLTEQVA